MSEANKEIVRRYQDGYNRNELDVLDELLDPNWTSNAWPQGVPQSIQMAKESHQMMLAVFPDVRYETLDLIAEGDRVVQRWVFRATFRNEFLGLTPTGKMIEGGGISIFRIANGRIVEHWAYAGEFDLLDQVGWELPEVLRPHIHRHRSERATEPA